VSEREARSAAAPFRLRAAEERDAEALNAMANLPGVRHGTLRLPFTPLSATRAMVCGDDPNRHMIVAERGGVAVGVVTLIRGRGRTAHGADLGMWVHDDHAGQGIGRALLEAALDLADNWLGLRRVSLEVFVDNAPAIALYERHGFEREGRLRAESLRDGALVDVYVMGRLREAPPHLTAGEAET
jgi:putative acetyltransferase